MTENSAPRSTAFSDPVYTVGHSNRSWTEFLHVIQSASIKAIFDVRRFPVSRRYPQYCRDDMERALAAATIEYQHFSELGGFRTDPEGPAASGNDGWPPGFFRNYADYTQTSEFHRSLMKMYRALKPGTAIMCAEKDWRTCHRQIIADYMLGAGYRVIHLIDETRSEEAGITPFAIVSEDCNITYKAVRQQAAFDF